MFWVFGISFSTHISWSTFIFRLRTSLFLVVFYYWLFPIFVAVESSVSRQKPRVMFSHSFSRCRVLFLPVSVLSLEGSGGRLEVSLTLCTPRFDVTLRRGVGVPTVGVVRPPRDPPDESPRVSRPTTSRPSPDVQTTPAPLRECLCRSPPLLPLADVHVDPHSPATPTPPSSPMGKFCPLYI